MITVSELIEQLKKLPQDKKVKMSTKDTDCGEALRVQEYWECVVIENDKILYKDGF